MASSSGTVAIPDVTKSADVNRQLWTLSLFPLSEHIAWSSSFPYMYAMVESFNENSGNADDGSIAFYASLLVSFFTFGEFLMAPQWARISDKIGRKPTLLLGSLGTMFSSAAFGLSRSLSWAFVARFFAGSLNPNLGILKTYVGELVTKDDQARGFSIISFMAGLGFIIGPIVGGYLAQPNKTFPSIFRPGTIWSRFPFLLPNLLVVVCLVISCILGLLFLREVHPDFQSQQDAAQRLISSLWSFSSSSKAQENHNRLPVLDDESATEQDPLLTTQAKVSEFSYKAAFTTQIQLQILSQTLMSFEGIAFATLIPTFLASPQPSGYEHERTFGGGFGLSTSNVSNILLTQAIASVLCQIFIIPQFIKSRGTLLSYRISLGITLLSYPVMPFSLLLPGFQGYLFIMAILWIQALFGGISYTTTSMMITNNCESPSHLATINGVAASAGCLAKTAGPALIGVLYDQGVKAGNIVVPFCALSIVGLLTLGLSWKLREELESKDDDEVREVDS